VIDPFALVAPETLAEKSARVFPGLAIDKRRLPASQLQKRGVPAYVGEWLLDTVVPGLGELRPDEASRVGEWAAKFIPAPNDQQVIKHRLINGETVKILTPVQVEIRLKGGQGQRVARMSLIGIEDAIIPDEFVTAFPDLLRQGMWGVVEISQLSDGVTLVGFRPMQASVDLGLFKTARREFMLDEWKELVLLSMGYAPEALNEEEQLLLLCRLLPLVQKGLHLIELAPKATGKSYLFENISPRVRLISGGNVTPAVLFVNNASGQWGLLARFAAVALDEVQTLKFERPEEIVGALKGFLANGKLTRGGLHETSSDCSLVLLANIRLDEQQRPIHGDRLVEELPAFLRETAFLDRIKGLLPGWKIRKLGPDSFANGVGLKADFFGDALVALRDDLSFDQYVARRLRLEGSRPYQRNHSAVQSIATGMMKILFPHGEVTDGQFERYCLAPAIQLRQLVWDQLFRLDPEFRQWDETLRARMEPAP
jgi:ATP-dependent Lon protease